MYTSSPAHWRTLRNPSFFGSTNFTSPSHGALSTLCTFYPADRGVAPARHALSFHAAPAHRGTPCTRERNASLAFPVSRYECESPPSTWPAGRDRRHAAPLLVSAPPSGIATETRPHQPCGVAAHLPVFSPRPDRPPPSPPSDIHAETCPPPPALRDRGPPSGIFAETRPSPLPPPLPAFMPRPDPPVSNALGGRAYRPPLVPQLLKELGPEAARQRVNTPRVVNKTFFSSRGTAAAKRIDLTSRKTTVRPRGRRRTAKGKRLAACYYRISSHLVGYLPAPSARKEAAAHQIENSYPACSRFCLISLIISQRSA